MELVILAIVVLVVAVVALGFVQQRRRAGGVIAGTKGSGRRKLGP